MEKDLGNYWIETTSCGDERTRSKWLVRIGSEILQIGEVADDPTGSRALVVAMAWVGKNHPGKDFQWKHLEDATNDG
jgi:hypothetical protein